MYNSLPTIAQKFIDYEVENDKPKKKDIKDATTDTEKNTIFISNLLLDLYEKNMNWYDNLPTSADTTPSDVNGSPVYGGDDPTKGIDAVTGEAEKVQLTSFGVPDENGNYTGGVYYKSYNGNAISLDENNKPVINPNNIESIYDATANTKAIFSMVYVHFAGMMYDNLQDQNATKMEKLADKLFDVSHAYSTEISEVYQCSGCKVLKNYSCTDMNLADLKDAFGNNYGFLENDNETLNSNQSLNNHNGQGCTAYKCTDNYDYQDTWKTVPYDEYGCDSKTFTKAGKLTISLTCNDGAMAPYYSQLSSVVNKQYLSLDEINNIYINNVLPYQDVNSAFNPINTITDSGLDVDSASFNYIDKDCIEENNEKYRVKEKGILLGYYLSPINGNENASLWTLTPYYSVKGYYCKGKHYGCPGKHSRTYCTGHTDLTVHFAVAGISTDEEDDCKLTALDPYGKPALEIDKNEQKNIIITGMDSPDAEYSSWGGWNSEINKSWLYGLYNQNWKTEGFSFLNQGFMEAGD